MPATGLLLLVDLDGVLYRGASPVPGVAAEHIRGGGVEGTDGGNGWDAAGRPDAVVVGLDPKFDYLRLTVATDCVRAGARFVATNRDPVYPTERAVRPGAGAIVAAVEAASGVTATSIGKPEPYLLEEAARAVGRDAHEAIMIGDGLRSEERRVGKEWRA